MNFNEVVNAVGVVIESKNVPFVVGRPGIGKSQLAKEIAKNKNMELVTLYGSLLKEGELGGIPYPRIIERNGKEIPINDFSIYVKFNEILENHENGKKTLLFIDEINK